MKIVNLIIMIVLVVSIPVSIICLANTLTVRMPDLYQYELKSTEVLGDLYIEKSEDELGEFFSEFMMGKADEFQIEYQVGENIDKLFTNDEQKTMGKFKRVSDVILLTGMVAFLLSLAGYFLLYKQNLKPLLRRTFVRATIVFASLAGTIAILSFIPKLEEVQYKFFFDYEIKSFLVLPNLITKDFLGHSAQATVAISIILMILLWYFTWKITKPRRIFGALR